MVAPAILGRMGWGLDRDKDGNRTYTLKWLIKAEVNTGPATIMETAGLAAIGASWGYGGDNDAWAFCRPTMKITPVVKREPCEYWTADQTFSTSTKASTKRCQDDSIENPLDEPDRISGSFVKYTKEATKDRNGDAINNSAHQTVRGSIVEFDYNRPTVRIGKNLLVLPLATFAEMMDTVNDAPLWGCAERCIKLSNVSWERLLYGTCNFYYTVDYEFDIDFNTFDREALDEGTQIIGVNGALLDPTDTEWPVDKNGNPKPSVLLNGAGKELDNAANEVYFDIEYYEESNLLLLGIPTSL